MQLGVVDDSDRIFQEHSHELARAQEELGEMETGLQCRRQDVLLAENRINRARSRCTTLEVDLKTYQVKHASISESILTLNEEVVVLERGLADIQRLLAGRRQEQASSEDVLERAREDAKSILARFRACKKISGRGIAALLRKPHS